MEDFSSIVGQVNMVMESQAQKIEMEKLRVRFIILLV